MTDAAVHAGGRDRVVSPGRQASRVARARALEMLLTLALLLAPGGGHAATGGNPAPADPFATLQVGHWIRIEGSVQADSTVLCEDLRVLTGDFLDDDWSLRGYVAAVDTMRREVVIAGVRVLVTEDTDFDGPKTFRSFSALRLGSLVDVEGGYLRNRRLLAKEVDDESDDVGATPVPRNQIRLVAKVERLDARKRLITAMGFVIQVSEKIRVRTAIE